MGGNETSLTGLRVCASCICSCTLPVGCHNPLPHPPTLPSHLQEGVNGRIVHLSNALCSYGNSFQYTEMFSTGRGWFGWAGAIATTASLALVGAAVLPPLSWVAQYVLPKPGQGPSEQVRGGEGEGEEAGMVGGVGRERKE